MDVVASSGSSPADARTEADAAAQNEAQPPALSRRHFVWGAAGAAVMLGLGAAARYAFADEPLLRPPGGQDEAHLLSACIKCNRCISVCPTSAIAVAGLESGLANARTPRMDYRPAERSRFSSSALREGTASQHSHDEGIAILTQAKGSNYCNFCGLCIANCPTGALQPFDAAAQWIGLAVVFPDNCLAFEREGGCRKCVDYCPFSAITLDEHSRPVVDATLCNGCGVCENICPTYSYRTKSGIDSRRGINVEIQAKGRPQ
ncbi:MAG: 4Fe-4S dicluster domain-containing protein [Coriobacteriales bacterium]|jgi:ferredoxin-type protein NapG|nr:4Fe-4S dicluster domain-containing protein [Coriobacteriales bacterium]